MKTKRTLLPVYLIGIAWLVLAVPFAAHAQFNFTTNNGSITITAYTGTNRLMVIPNTINGLPVTDIVPTNLDIFDNAFNVSVTNIMIPGSVTNIGFEAFGFDEYGAANNPDTDLSAITVDTNNPTYGSLDGVLIDKLHGTLIQYPYGKPGNSYTIPSGINSIAEDAFYYCTNLLNVTIPDSVTNIGAQAFEVCFGLNNAVIGNGVTSIADEAFWGCTNLTNILIGPNVLTIGEQAFCYCTRLSNIIIPASVTNIGIQAFEDSRNLEGVFFQGNAPSLVDSANLFALDRNPTVYYLPGTTGWGTTFGTVPAQPTTLWNPQAQTGGAGFGVVNNQFGFNITGTTNIPIVVEASASLTAPVWVPLTNVNLTNGLFYFTDPQWTNYPSRFYRISPP